MIRVVWFAQIRGLARFDRGVGFHQMVQKYLMPPAVHDCMVTNKEQAEFCYGTQENSDAEQRRVNVGCIKEIEAVILYFFRNVSVLSRTIKMRDVFNADIPRQSFPDALQRRRTFQIENCP